jgi:tellurite resistance protein TerC
MFIHSVSNPLMWGGFILLILVLLLLDLGLFHRRAHTIQFREALLSSIMWIGLALLFNVAIYFFYGYEPAIQFLTGYLIEKALSVDNIFVFLVIFSYFSVPPAVQHRVLFFGILGALIMRAVFIIAGAALIQRFSWLEYVLGLVLVLTAYKLLTQSEDHLKPDRTIVYRLGKRFLPMVPDYRGTNFFVREAGRNYATPLFLVLLTVEFTDLVFAVDSIPAVFGITSDPFIVFTSNIFAILGLRALFFLVAGSLGKLRYLRVGLSAVLLFVGVKMLFSELFHIPVLVSLAIVGGLIFTAAAASLMVSPRNPSAKDSKND